MRNNTSNERFVAYVDRFGDTAMISVYAASGSGAARQIDFSKKLEYYETLSKGALGSAQLQIDKMLAEAKAVEVA